MIVYVALPHLHKILGSDDQRLVASLLLKEPGDGGRDDCLAEPDHVTDHDAATVHHDARRDPNGRSLELEELALHALGDAVLEEPLPGFLR